MQNLLHHWPVHHDHEPSPNAIPSLTRSRAISSQLQAHSIGPTCWPAKCLLNLATNWCPSYRTIVCSKWSPIYSKRGRKVPSSCAFPSQQWPLTTLICTIVLPWTITFPWANLVSDMEKQDRTYHYTVCYLQTISWQLRNPTINTETNGQTCNTT